MLRTAAVTTLLLASVGARADDAPGSGMFDSCNAYYCHLASDPPAVATGLEFRPNVIIIKAGSVLKNVCTIASYTLGQGASGTDIVNVRPIPGCLAPK